MSMVRPLILSLLILSLVAAGLPISDSLAAHLNRRAYLSWRARHSRHRHTRAWWRRHRAYLRRQQAYAARRNALSLAAAPKDPADAASTKTGGNSNSSGATKVSGRTSLVANLARETRAPFDLTLPASWSGAGTNASGEMKFVVRTLDGTPAGQAVLGTFNPSKTEAGGAVSSQRAKMLGGVPLSTLRRTVIDKMIAEGGWVVNDVEREMHGRRVYVVFAQTGAAANGKPQRLTYYFTEVDGRLYRLATNTSLDLNEQAIAASEQVVSTFRVGKGDAMAAK